MNDSKKAFDKVRANAIEAHWSFTNECETSIKSYFECETSIKSYSLMSRSHATKSNVITTKWKTLIMRIVVLFEHDAHFVVKEQTLCIEKVYRKDSIRILMNFIRSLLVENSHVINIQKKLITFNEVIDWILNHDVFWYQNRLYLSLTLRSHVIEKNHDDSLIDHFDTKKTLKLISKKYYWSTWKVVTTIQECEIL